MSGLAIQGPLKGKRLTLVPHDELTFATWKAEQPAGRVLKTDRSIVKEEDYEPADWEDQVGDFRCASPTAPGGPLEPRTLVVGIAIEGKSKAWPHASVLSSGRDDRSGRATCPSSSSWRRMGRSLRAFDRRVKGQTLDVRSRGHRPRREHAAGSGDDERVGLQGTRDEGRTGRRASSPRVDYLLDYWFDWRTYHPDTEVLKPWQPAVKKGEDAGDPAADGAVMRTRQEGEEAAEAKSRCEDE